MKLLSTQPEFFYIFIVCILNIFCFAVKNYLNIESEKKQSNFQKNASLLTVIMI